MKKAIELFVKYKFYANIIIAVVLLAGVASMLSMRKSFFPEVESNKIVINVFYPGASPKEMEEGVTSLIEESLRQVVGIKEFNSTSSENYASINIETDYKYDIDEILIEVKNSVDGISSFPAGAERPSVYKVRSRSQVLRMTVSGQVDMLTLKEYADQIEDDMLKSGIVSEIMLENDPSPEIAIEVDEASLRRYEISISEIATAVRSNNQDLSAGMLKSDREEMLIRLRSRSVDPNKIAQIIVRANDNGGHIRIGDLARVSKKTPDSYNHTTMNGKESLSLIVNKLPEQDLEVINDYCEAYIADFNAKDYGVKIDITFSFMPLLMGRLEMLLENGFIGLILVIISLAVFLNLRLSFWVAWGIPSAFLAMFIVANMIGLTINMISLFGMILVIGILVDDGIVIAENIFSHFEKGKSPMRAAVDGTVEVLPAIVTSVLTTMIAFAPLMFINGGHMQFIGDMAWIVILCLFFSLWEAFFVLPAHLGTPHVLKKKKAKEKASVFSLRPYFDRFIKWLSNDVYEPVLRWLIKWRYAAIFAPITFILITAGLIGGGHIKTTFFPPVDFDFFTVSIAFTPGESKLKTEEYLERFEKAVWEVNDDLKEKYNDSINPIKFTFKGVGSSFQGSEIGNHAGEIFVITKNLEDFPIAGMDIAKLVQNKIGTVPEANKFSVAGVSRWGKPISISLLGSDIYELKKASIFLKEELEKIPELNGIVDNYAPGKQEIQLELLPKAYTIGLNQMAIAQQVRQGFFGEQVQLLQEGRNELRVWVKYPEEGRQYMGQLDNIRIKTPQGSFPLSELVDYKIERGPTQIKRYNGDKEIRVEAETADKAISVAEITDTVKKRLIPKLEAAFPGMKYEFQGQAKNSGEAMSELKRNFIVAIILIIFVLMLHFRSAGQAIIVLMMIPLSVLAAVWGHGIEGKQISMLSSFGIVALSGVIINDAVVLLARFNDLLKLGYKMTEAVVEAGKSRLRPILLTTITTTVGLYPLILEKSFQAQFLIPMAISLAYGVAIGTFFILLYFPILIYVKNDIKRALLRFKYGHSFDKEEVETAIKNLKIEQQYRENK